MSSGADHAAVRRWLESELPARWQQMPFELVVDNDEILVVVTLPEEAATEVDPACEEIDAIKRWRAETRDARMDLATAAERRFGRKVSWGARAGDVVATFTTVSVPVMTRLRLGERQVLDTLIDAGIARSRSEALAWCVRLVGDNEQEWITELRGAFAAVELVRDQGPRARRREPPG